MALKVHEQSDAVKAMAEHWAIVDALLGGTSAMRKAGERYLPRWPNEDAAAYKARLSTATLYPALRRTLNVMAGKPLSKQLIIGDDVPEEVKALLDDVDARGNSLHVFAGEAMYEVLAKGVCGVLADSPPNTAGPTLAQQVQAGIRPHLALYKADSILGWKSSIEGGKHTLTQLRLAEFTEVDDGDYGTTTVARVRVLTPGAWELWEDDGKGEYTLIEQGATGLSVIPFVTLYGVRTGFMQGQSPLLDLAHMNVKHWQSQSDQDTILHVARVPLLVASTDDEDFKLVVGASSAVRLPLGSSLQYVEHSGAAIAAGVQAIEALEKQMIQTGAELLVQQPGQRSATEANNEAEGNKSELLRIVEQFEDAMDQCLQLLADWIRQGMEGGHISLFKDFTAATLSDASAQLVIAIQQGGLISKHTALREMQRRGIVSPDVEPDEELAQVETEGPALGTLNDGPAQ